jgi:hypothetical protein
MKAKPTVDCGDDDDDDDGDDDDDIIKALFK